VCECTVCGEFFTGLSAFDAHLMRVGCQPPGDVRNKKGEVVLRLYERSAGPTWGSATESPYSK
jgi:hypothetical protein